MSQTIYLFVISCTLLLYSTGQEKTHPDDVEGVWKVISASRDGNELPLSYMPPKIPYLDYDEIIIASNRIVIVSDDGTAAALQTRILAESPQLKFECFRLGSYNSKARDEFLKRYFGNSLAQNRSAGFGTEDNPSYLLLERMGDQLKFALVGKENDRIDASKGAHQLVMTATRQ